MSVLEEGWCLGAAGDVTSKLIVHDGQGWRPWEEQPPRPIWITSLHVSPHGLFVTASDRQGKDTALGQLDRGGNWRFWTRAELGVNGLDMVAGAGLSVYAAGMLAKGGSCLLRFESGAWVDDSPRFGNWTVRRICVTAETVYAICLSNGPFSEVVVRGASGWVKLLEAKAHLRDLKTVVAGPSNDGALLVVGEPGVVHCYADARWTREPIFPQAVGFALAAGAGEASLIGATRRQQLHAAVRREGRWVDLFTELPSIEKGKEVVAACTWSGPGRFLAVGAGGVGYEVGGGGVNMRRTCTRSTFWDLRRVSETVDFG